MKVQLALFQVMLINFVRCNPCTIIQSLNISTGVEYPNGSIIHDSMEYKVGAWYEVEENNVRFRLGCPCIDRVCLWKCCEVGSAFITYANCSEALIDSTFSPSVYKEKEQTNVIADQQFYYMYGVPCNNKKYRIDHGLGGEEVYLQQNGSLYEVTAGNTIMHEPGNFCMDMTVPNSSKPAWLAASICFPDKVHSSDDSPEMYLAYAVGMSLSVLFLLATFLVYAIIPDLRNIHGMCLMAYCAGLIVAYTSLAYLKVHVEEDGVSMARCVAVAFVAYYAFQTSFFWLNVMCYDIWRSFSSYRGGSTNKRRENKRFALYALYAWGVPLILTAITMSMQFSNLPSNIITPRIGKKKCWFYDWLSESIYFMIPVLVLVVCNTVLFSVTAHRIRTIRQETAILKSSESSRSDKLKKDKQRYSIYLKLFMVMGVNWTVEIISFAVGGSNPYWIVLDMPNIALGIFVFFLFVWKKKVRTLLQKKFRTLFGMQQAERHSQRKWMSSAAQTEDTRISSDDSAMRLKDLH